MAKLTVTEQLLQAQATITDLKDQIQSQSEVISKLSKEVEQQKSYYKSADEERTKLKNDIEQVHQVLDTVPHAIPRKTEHEESYYRVERTIITRLAAWLCSRSL